MVRLHAGSFTALSLDSVPTATTWLPEVRIVCERDAVDNEGKLRVWALDNDEHTLKKEVGVDSELHRR